MRFVSRFLIPLILIMVLVVPDFRSTVSHYIQGAALQSGIMNASAISLESKEKFDFEFKLKKLNGEVVDFNSYRGKVIFINLWATWCGPCRAEMPTIQQLYESMDQTKIAFIILSIDEPQLESKVKKYISDRGFQFPVFTPAGYLPQQLNIPSIPTTFIIDKEGNIAQKEVGMRNYNTTKFKKFLDGLANK